MLHDNGFHVDNEIFMWLIYTLSSWQLTRNALYYHLGF